MATATAPTGTAATSGPATPTVACKVLPDSFQLMSAEQIVMIMIEVILLIIFLVVHLRLTLLGGAVGMEEVAFVVIM